MASSYNMVYVPVSQRHKGFSKPTIAVGYCTPKKCLVVIAAAMVLGTVILQCLFSFRHAFSDMHLRTDVDGELVVVSHDIAEKHGAVCLDGTSHPGYYIKRGIDEGEQRWLIVIPHSDWCNSAGQCYSWKDSVLKGTMDGAPVTHQFAGILSSDPTENEYFADWNMIRLIPCSGSSFLGNATAPLTGNFKDMKLRGAAVLSATIEHIISTTDIANSMQTVLYGEGSGAVSALAYTSYIRKQLPYVLKFTTLIHSGLLFDVTNSKYNISDFFNLHNIKGNNLLSETRTTDSLNMEKLLRSPRPSAVIIFSTGIPMWPMHTMYGCETPRQCSGYLSNYFGRIVQLHSRRHSITNLLTILTRCDWPLKTTVTNDDPRILNRSVYELLVGGLSGSVKPSLYANSDCGDEMNS